MPSFLQVGYAYPTSKHAADCGASETGCWVVTRVLNIKTGLRLKYPVLATKVAFKTEAEAQKWALGWMDGFDEAEKQQAEMPAGGLF